MSSKFDCKTYAKWILCGEHAVIRGFPAIVCPLKEKYIAFEYNPSDLALTIVSGGHAALEIKENLNAAIEQALKICGLGSKKIQGKISIQNNIPPGGGLGLSAALSSAISKWFAHLKYIAENDIFTFAKALEDLFHGKSSGVDIAGSLYDQPIYYDIENGPQMLNIHWSPLFTLTYSGKRSSTYNCVSQVQQQLREAPAHANQIDGNMASATNLALRALENSDHNEGLLWLKEAINIAAQCFNDWKLLTPELTGLTEAVHQLGGLASKPTGSGAGGYLLSLWRTQPTALPEPFINVRL